MQLVKKNIHMDRIKCNANSQITLEGDSIVSDQKQDIDHIILEKGNVIFDEIRAMENSVLIRGKFVFSTLYLTDEEEKMLSTLDGQIAFDEKIRLDGITPNDVVEVSYQLEDLKIQIINSRKISVKVLINLKACVNELFDEDFVIDVEQNQYFEVKREQKRVAILQGKNKDIFRLKEEIDIPSGFSNIVQILWSDFVVNKMEYTPLEDRIAIQGEVNCFFLYEAEDRSCKYFEHVVQIKGSLDCGGINEQSILNVQTTLSNVECNTTQDYDGEERLIILDVVLGMAIEFYENTTVDVIEDIYGTRQGVELSSETKEWKEEVVTYRNREKISKKINFEKNKAKIESMIYTKADVIIEDSFLEEGAVVIEGILKVQGFYKTIDEDGMYHNFIKEIPFESTIELHSTTQKETYKIEWQLEQLHTNVLGEYEVEIKALVCISVIAFTTKKCNVIKEIQLVENLMEQKNKMPSLVVYFAKDKDTLWDIGKQFYCSREEIATTNNLEGKEIKAGDKILIVKSLE
ncbi:MAG: DUF3794 and LysM peptidoglycan-binding domain-containing protein [Lachnospiraceae bacterium]